MAKITVADVPHMLKMWDREKNTEAPEAVSANCKNPKHWKCPVCGYSCSVPPKTRYQGSGKCPCHESNKVIKKGINDVLTIVKGLDAFIDEDNDFKEIYKQGVDSNLSVNFKCDECGRKWNATLRSQIKKDGNGGYIAVGCPHYSTVKRKKEEVPFCTEVKSIIRFWDYNNPMDPATTRSNSTDRAHFICKNCGYDWTTEIREQTRGTGKCKCCELQRVTRKGFTDVFTLVPESKRFFNFDKNKDIDIYTIPLRNVEIQIDWKCPDCGREWQSSLSERIKGKKDNYRFRECQDCYIERLKKKITPVASVPKLVKQWDFKKNRARGLDPNLTSAYSTDHADWRCKDCGYEWEAQIKGRMDSDGTCPLCNGAKGAVKKGVNDALTLCPELTTIYDFEYNEKNGIDIYKEGTGSTKEVHFKCQKCGNEWNSPIYKRVKKNEDGTYSLVDCSNCSHGLFRKVPYSVEFPLLAKMYREDLNKVPLDSIRGAEGILKTYHWWDCPECGETFDSTLNSMITSYESPTHGCPFCSHTRLRKGESFADLHPELMDEYDPENTIDPYQTFPYCKDDAKWICRKCGYHWNASFALRHRGDGKCPVCNRTVLIPDKNSFAAVYPELVKYWADSNERRADETFYNSSLWLQFICPVCGGEHGAYIDDFVAGDSCPYCKGIILSPEVNSLKVTHPNIARRWSPNNNFGSDTLFSTSWKWAKWICDTCSCEYPARVKDVVNSNDECPYCAGKRLSPETNSLKALYPDVARRWSPNNDFGSEMVLPTSWLWAKWICDTCSCEYGASVRDVVNGTDECPYCAGKRAIPGKTSLKAIYPDIAALLSPNDGHDPDQMLPDAHTMYIWRCPEYNLDYVASTYEMINGYTCPYCDGRKVVPGKTSLKALYPNIAELLSPNDGHDPDLMLPNSNTPHIWRCPKYNLDYVATTYEMINGYICPYCDGKKAVPGKTSLKALYPNIAELLSPNDGHDPDLMLPDVNTPHIWRCPECNYDYNATTHEMINGYSCPYCNDRILMPGFNSFGDKHPNLISEMDKMANYGLSQSPYEVLDTSTSKFWFNCKNDPKHKYPMSPRTRLMFEKRHREPCPYCRGQRRKLNHFAAYKKESIAKEKP